MAKRRHPSKISVRPATAYEGSDLFDFVVWVYGRKVQVQQVFTSDTALSFAIGQAVATWHQAMSACNG